MLLCKLAILHWFCVRNLMNTLIFRYATSVVPIGAMFAMTLWLGNSAYLYISVAFAQMLKATSKYQVPRFFFDCTDLSFMAVVSV